MYCCPQCGSDHVAGLAQCPCGADLSALRDLNAVAGAWFNRGLEFEAKGETGPALECFSACSIARPSDAAARRALAKLWLRLGHPGEARRCLDIRQLGEDASLEDGLLLRLIEAGMTFPGSGNGCAPAATAAGSSAGHLPPSPLDSEASSPPQETLFPDTNAFPK